MIQKKKKSSTKVFHARVMKYFLEARMRGAGTSQNVPKTYVMHNVVLKVLYFHPKDLGQRTDSSLRLNVCVRYCFTAYYIIIRFCCLFLYLVLLSWCPRFPSAVHLLFRCVEGVIPLSCRDYSSCGEETKTKRKPVTRYNESIYLLKYTR